MVEHVFNARSRGKEQMKIVDVVKLSEELERSEGHIEGWDSLRGIFQRGKEGDPHYVFRTTYPTTEIRDLLEAVNEKLSGRRDTGFFEILGGYGTGKSRILVLLWHVFKNREKALEWAKSHGIKLEIPEGIQILAFNLLDENPTYLWEPIFKGLGREDLLEKVKDFPGYNLLKEAIPSEGYVVIIMDELEAWYRGKEERAKNLNFIQVLAEAACEKNGRLLVFCSLYGEEGDLLARIERVKPYRVNLTLSKDRPRVILFRLFDKIDAQLAPKVVEEYMKHYEESEVNIGDRLAYEKRMIETYPIHPELVEVLLTKFSSSPRYQNTRGVLGLLGSVVYKKAADVDMILASDVDADERELLTLDRVLTENAKKDADLIGREDARKLLNVILLHSFGTLKEVGASRNDVILGVLRPGININDVDSLLASLPNIAPHVWVKEHRYVIGREANVITVIQNKALENVSRGEISEALNLVKAKLKKDSSYVAYHPNENYSDQIEDEDRLRVVVSLKALDQLEINDFFKGRQFANRLVLYIPKEGDITKNEELLVVAERIRLSEEYREEVSDEDRKLLNEQKNKDIKLLSEKLSDIYGYWVKVTSFEDGEVRYRLIECDLDKVKSLVRKHYSAEVIRDEISMYLEDKKTWVKYEDLVYDFKTIPGKPIVIVEDTVREALKSLYEEGKIVVEHMGKMCRTPEPMPLIKSETRIILAKYAPPRLSPLKPEEKEEEKEGAKGVEGEGERPSVKVGKEEGIKPSLQLIETVETSEYPTPFLLSTEVERRVPQNAIVHQVRIELSKMSFDNFDALRSFISSINLKKVSLSNVTMQMIVKGPMGREETLKLIENLPPKLFGGTLKAYIEVEKVA